MEDDCVDHMNVEPRSFAYCCLSMAVFVASLACGCPSAGSASGLEARTSDPKESKATGHDINPKKEPQNAINQRRGDVEIRIIWVDPYTIHRRIGETDMWTMHIGVMLIDRREHPEKAEKNGRRLLSRAGGNIMTQLALVPKDVIQIRRIDAPGSPDV